MTLNLSKILRSALGGCAVLVSALTLSTVGAAAQQKYVLTEDGLSQGKVANGKIVRRTTVRAERYIPTIWVDPDGCEHWAMDDGFEGYMTPHVTRQGIPVCRRGNTCAVMNSDQLFATNQATINGANKRRLQQFFKSGGATAYAIEGHTDSRASDAYNMNLSQRRANAVAQVARSVGARVT